jgi:hypothetical protein
VLCPKMKVPISTDSTPHTSRQHLPTQSPMSVQTASLLCPEAQHVHRVSPRPGRDANLEKILSCLLYL